MQPRTPQRGLTIPEVLISVFIFGLLFASFWTAFKDNFTLSRRTHASLVAQQELQTLARRFGAEVRAAGPSEIGSYAIGAASSTEFTFYADADNDGLNERIRYYVDGTAFRKGTLVPTGSPAAYTGSETMRTITSDLVATTTPAFLYYDTAYAGTSTALAEPVDIADIRLVKLTLVVDADTEFPPEPIVSTTQVTIRSIKDNL